MKKRLISMLLVVCMVLTMLPVGAMAAEINSGQAPEAPTATEVRNPFADVKTGDWFYESVMYVLQNELFKGVSNTKFDPTGTMTRSMYVTVMGRIAEIDPAQYTGNGGFSDVQAGSWYGPYVVWAKEKGITGGVGGGRFTPDGLVTREQMAAMTVRFFESYGIPFPDKVTDTQPKDLDSVASWAKEAVLKLWACGLFQGDNNGNFNPKNNASRAEAAAFCGRVDTRVEQWFIETGVKEDPDKKTEKPDKSSNDSDDDSGGGDSTNTYAVRFYDGDRLIDTLYAKKDEPLGAVPAVEKTSRPDGVFEGWYTDKSFTTPFYPDNAVSGNTSVYAKYTQLPGEELTVTSFAQVDLGTDAGFTVVGSGNTGAIILTPKDGSDPVELSITGGSPYTVTAVGGFKPGASYELTLPEGMNFVGPSGETLPDTVRTASFTIEKEAVANLQTSDEVRYVQNADPSVLKTGDTVALENVQQGNLICFYKTTNPEQRDYASGNAYMDDPETWFKAGSVSGNTVTLAELEDTDNEKMYDVPDNFPVTGALPTGDGGTLTLTSEDNDGYALDTAFYAQMVEDNVTADLNYANTKVGVGDFVSIYTSSSAISDESDIYFGKITGYDSNTGTITYIKSSAEEIEASMDLYVQPVLEGDDLLSDEAAEKIEKAVLAQVRDSGFAEEAGYMLADLATQTDGFRNMDGVQMLLTSEDGQPLSDEEIELLNLGKSFELKDGIDLTVEVIRSGDQLHFQDKGSVQLAIGIDAKFEVEVEDGGKIVIDLSATFVQELAIGVTANGELVKKEILFIPIPIGVKIGSSVDLLSYTGIRVDVQAYTVAEEDKDLWEQLQEAVKDPTKIAGLLPDELGELKKGLETAGDVLDKIDEVKGQLEQVRDNAEKAMEYTQDLELLWGVVGQVDGMPTEEDWEAMGEALGKTNVSKDLMDMLDLSTETELDADRYADSLSDLLQKYSEMLEQETDWVELVRKEMCTAEVNICGLVIYVKADFVVRADMNIAMGASLQYQVGKRYNFWFKIGLFKPSAGSSTMDLVDEQFAFQYYVMGKLGIKMGVEATAGFAIGSADVARVGLHLELGPYVKLYGFFIYEYERTRAANTADWVSNQRMAGALYLDFGLYLIVGVDAEALTLFEVSYDFVDAEFPLLTAGEKKYPYEFQYKPMEDELVLVQDEDGNSTNGITMTLPDEYRAVSYCNLETGYLGARAFPYDNYNFSFSNPAFSMDGNGKITVDVPDNTRYMECDLTITYKYGKLAFSQYDMQVTVPLVWTNLSTDEIAQYYTASVRVGNNADGYDIVWSQRVRKNQEFTLPTEVELKALIGYNDAMYASFSYPDAGQTKTLISNTSYDCTVSYTDYALTVSNIQNSDGSTTSQTFHTTYGGTFDFSDLADTGTNKPDDDADTAKYTKFIGVTTTATVTANGQTQTIDLSQPVTGKVAGAIKDGSVSATAEYGDDSVLVTYTFSGITADDHTERIRKGTASDYDIYTLAATQGMAVKSVTPVLGPVSSATTYYVECGVIEGDSFTITFEENGGATVADITRVGGSLIGTLPTPTQTGFTFGGWFTDAELTQSFTATLMPKENLTLYAKWTAGAVTVTLNVNGGNSWAAPETGTRDVAYNSPYGQLPTPTRDGHAFLGWFTAAEGGDEVTAETVVVQTASHTLYAHWYQLVAISQSFTYTKLDTNPVYFKDTQVELIPATWPVADEGAPALEQSSFTFKFMRQGDSEYITTDYPVNAGTYNVTISRPADAYYAKFEQTISGVLTIDKATRTLPSMTLNVSEAGFTYLDLVDVNVEIDDLSSEAKFVYRAYADGMTWESNPGESYIKSLATGTYNLSVAVIDDPNYEDANTGTLVSGKTKEAPTGNWKDYAEAFTVTDNAVTITTAGQLAYLAKEINAGKGPLTYSGITITLGNDIDLSEHQWTPIGTGDLNGKTGTPYMGTFNGNGHTISGMYGGAVFAGLFGLALQATITDITIEDSLVTGPIAGGVVGSAPNSTISHCSSDAVIWRYQISGFPNAELYMAGGILGADKFNNNDGGHGSVTITNCVNTGLVLSYGSAGGIAGMLESTSKIERCTNHGNVASNADALAGGIAGQAYENTLVDCENDGTPKTLVGKNLADTNSLAALSLKPEEETVYTVTLDVNGGAGWTDGAGTLTVTPGRPYGELPTPTKGNSAFLGWFTAAGEGGTLVTADTTVTEENDHTLYAHWEEPVEETVYTVTLDVNGGDPWTDGAGTLTVTPGQPYGELPAPAKADSNFLGWFTAADESGTQVTADTIVTKENDHTLYAHWAAPVQDTEPQPEQASLPQEPAQEPQQVEPQPSDDAPKEDAQEPSKTEPQEDPADPQPTV